MPRFSHGDGRSIDVALRGRTVVLVGEGTSPPGERTYPSPGEAREACALIVGELLGAGFRFGEPNPIRDAEEEAESPPANPSYAALEAALDDAGDDASRYLVYADFLQSQGDPWGTLIALQARGPEYQAQVDAFLVERRSALFGEMSEAFLYRDVIPTWRFGFIVGARLRLADAASLPYLDLCRAFLGHRMTRLLESVELAEGHDSEPILRAAAQAKRLSSLRLLGTPPEHIDIGHFAESYPRLEALSLRGSFRGTLDLPRLKRLVLDEVSVHSVTEVLAGSTCPALVTFGGELSWWTYENGDGADIAELFNVTAAKMPRVENLVLSARNSAYAAIALGALGRSQLAPNIRTLALRFDTAPTMNAVRDWLPYLRRLDSVTITGAPPTQPSHIALTKALGEVLRIGPAR